MSSFQMFLTYSCQPIPDLNFTPDTILEKLGDKLFVVDSMICYPNK